MDDCICFKEIPRDGERFKFLLQSWDVRNSFITDRKMYMLQKEEEGALLTKKSASMHFLVGGSLCLREDRRFVWAARACVMAFGNSKRKLIVGGLPIRALRARNASLLTFVCVHVCIQLQNRNACLSAGNVSLWSIPRDTQIYTFPISLVRLRDEFLNNWYN